MDPYKFKSGAVFEVPLYGGFGFAFIKAVHFFFRGLCDIPRIHGLWHTDH